MQFELDDEETCAFLDLLTEAIRGRVKSEPGPELACPQPERPADHRTRFRGPRHHQGHLCRRGISMSLERHPLGGVRDIGAARSINAADRVPIRLGRRGYARA